ncbi:MAG: butyryl-CoA dehydrogenase [Sphingomonadales bacterium RIFCSPHIGHO2_01_FULL_65_20]|jgi:butyryl-CoA dehydrogenase|uniref:acyl-CoA dehydrogenase family protein n=1 Tax=Blastomonas TaxID=150203 RepID=UPI00082C57DB|nr:acyl-CoA dehydrogenase family protein [Sphingomonas ursincola]MBA4780408.1 acyl-CoA dehydrogenase family protein [Blastomonas sp.]MBY0619221.1 acyl-CoA dehydrogenase family protein [Sphingomonas ursincola]MCH2236426.1 acyl-CoA dehydrogenase family protein [Blastomonas sp.]OHC94601.1 MAG: butyryl-CoA dehydrogenase [Sphingomonadales bacterium RIFCSPHIGHO2_01_FULL_65_20]
MDFSLSDEQVALRETVRRFAQAELVPLAAELERDNRPVPRDMVRRYAEMGLLGINTPEALGGLGLTNLDALIVLEELAKVSSAVAFPVFEACVGPVRAIQHFAPDALKQRIVPQVCAGEMIVAVSMSEPAAGTALTDLTTRGVIADGKVTINGTKRWCSGGGHSDAYLVYTRLSDAPGAKGIGAVLVEKGTPGLSFGQPETLMGFRGVPSADLMFDDCVVPEGNIVVPAGGFAKLMEAFDLERCGNATMALGQASGALEDVLGYVQERQQFGKPLVDFQAVQMKLAEMQIEVEAARLLIWRAAANSDQGLPSILDSSSAKCFANQIARSVTGNAVQLMGGYGYSTQYPMERRMRDAWGWGIAGGAIDIQKVNIASAMVGRRFDQRR